MPAINVHAQSFTVSAGLEKTVASTESQFMFGYQTKKQWVMGTFYQHNFSQFTNEGLTDNYFWYGAFVGWPLAKSEKLSFYALLRSGLMERQFVVIVPSLETNIKVSKRLAVGVTSSFRKGYPAFSIKTQIHLFNRAAL
jgi:hypothetical protein